MTTLFNNCNPSSPSSCAKQLCSLLRGAQGVVQGFGEVWYKLQGPLLGKSLSQARGLEHSSHSNVPRTPQLVTDPAVHINCSTYFHIFCTADSCTHLMQSTVFLQNLPCIIFGIVWKAPFKPLHDLEKQLSK